jgi:tRNA(fMet)-specific endonuclease VapC
MRFLLDTNILSDLMRHPRGRAAHRLAAVGEASVATSIMVAAELRYGAAKRQWGRLTAEVEAMLARLEIVPFAAPADAMYGEIRAYLAARGELLGANDLFIAAHALALNRTLVAANEREFRRVPGLAVENWLRD